MAIPIRPNDRKLDARSMRPTPPATSEKPSTSSRLPTTDPVSEPRTTSVRPSWTAISAMISSGALPKVALRKPPMPGPVCSAACSVASPISHASGINASAESTNSRVGSRSDDVVQQDDERGERKQSVEDVTDHGRVPYPRGLPEDRPFVKSCAVPRTAHNPGVEQSVQAPSELPLRPQDEVECRRCEVHCDKVVYPGACIERSCPFVYAYEAWGHTYVGCMQTCLRGRDRSRPAARG